MLLLILWLLALSSGHVLGGLINVLLVIAIVVMLIRIFKGRKPVKPFGLEKFLKKGD